MGSTETLVCVTAISNPLLSEVELSRRVVILKKVRSVSHAVAKDSYVPGNSKRFAYNQVQEVDSFMFCRGTRPKLLTFSSASRERMHDVGPGRVT
jgi:hypothetical protein